MNEQVFDVGEHKYLCKEITVEDEMRSIELYGKWAATAGVNVNANQEIKNTCMNQALISFMIKEVDGKKMTPEEVFHFLRKIPRKDRLSLWIINGNLNEGVDFLSLANALATSEEDKKQSLNDSEEAIQSKNSTE